MDNIRNIQSNLTPQQTTQSEPLILQKKKPEEKKHAKDPSDVVDLSGIKIKVESEESSAIPIIKKHRDTTPNAPEKELTVLYYMNGQYDDIGPSAAAAMMGLELVGSDEKVNLVTQLGRNAYKPDPNDQKSGEFHVPIDGDWAGVRRYEIKQDDHKDLDTPKTEYLKLLDKIPNNALLNYIIGDMYWGEGNKTRAWEYFNKAKNLGIVDYMNEMQSDKSLAIRKEFNEATRHLEEAVIDKKVFKSHMLEDLGEAQMSDPSTLEDFVRWGMEKYPAKHYMLVIMGHGGAWMGASEMAPALMGQAITQGIEHANKDTGRKDKIDALVFNSCYMGNTEAAVEMKDAADVSLVSENYATTGTFHDWPNIINYIQTNISEGKPFNAEQFANDVVEYYRAKETEIKNNFPEFHPLKQTFLTLSAIDNKKLEGMVTSWQDFMTMCDAHGVTDQQLFSAIKDAKNFASGAYNPSQVFGFYDQIRDIGCIMDNVIESENFPNEVKTAAKAVKEALAEAVINEQHEGQLMEGAQGLTMWGPTNAVDVILMHEDYIDSAPNFPLNSGWGHKLIEATKNKPKPVVMGFMIAMKNLQGLAQKLQNPNISPQEKTLIESRMKQEEQIALSLKEDLDFSADDVKAFTKLVLPKGLEAEAFSPSKEVNDFSDEMQILKEPARKSRMDDIKLPGASGPARFRRR